MNPDAKTSLPVLLFVDDELRLARSCARHLTRVMAVESAGRVEEAIRAIHRLERVAGAIIDVNLNDPDGDGFSVGKELLSVHPATQTMIISCGWEENYASRALALGAVFSDRYDFSKTLYQFVVGLLSRLEISDEALRRIVDNFLRARSLSYREAQIVILAAADLGHAEIQERLAVEKDTLKSEIRHLLRKTEFGSLGDLVMSLRNSRRRIDA